MPEAPCAARIGAAAQPNGAGLIQLILWGASHVASHRFVHAEASPRGLWHVAVLATAENGDTTLNTKAAEFTVT
ncbi:hypothetical protein [Streptomyces sp. NPDC101166]|uniref:hypothetical protein n=1 Tax=Streptomyces sp. NPDC101166 TaxID=3366120 RepID=UPI0037FB17F7